MALELMVAKSLMISPKGGGHFKNESILDGVGGFPIVEVSVQDEMELGFTRENEFLDVGSVSGVCLRGV